MRRRNGNYLTPKRGFSIGGKNFFRTDTEILKDILIIEDWLDHVLKYYRAYEYYRGDGEAGSIRGRNAYGFLEDIRQRVGDFKYEYLLKDRV